MTSLKELQTRICTTSRDLRTKPPIRSRLSLRTNTFSSGWNQDRNLRDQMRCKQGLKAWTPGSRTTKWGKGQIRSKAISFQWSRWWLAETAAGKTIKTSFTKIPLVLKPTEALLPPSLLGWSLTGAKVLRTNSNQKLPPHTSTWTLNS